MDFEEKQDSRFTRLRLWDIFCFTYVSLRFFCFFCQSCFFSQRLMVEKRPSNALSQASDPKIMLRRLLLFHALYFLYEMFSLVICNTMFSVGCGFVPGFSKTTFCNAGFRVLFRDFWGESDIAIFPHIPLFTFILNLQYGILLHENFSKSCFTQVYWLKIMTSGAHSNGCNTGDLWLGRLVAFHDLLPLCCIHQLPASQKSLHSSRNGSSRLLYAQ